MTKMRKMFVATAAKASISIFSEDLDLDPSIHIFSDPPRHIGDHPGTQIRKRLDEGSAYISAFDEKGRGLPNLALYV